MKCPFSAPTTFQKGGIFIVPLLLYYEISVFAVFLPNYRANGVAFTTSQGYWEPLLTLRVLHWLHYVVVLFRLRAQGTAKRRGGAT